MPVSRQLTDQLTRLVPRRLPRIAGPVLVPVLDRVVTAAARWPVASQQRARHNALTATTALALRRAELREVEELLASPADPAASADRAARG